MGTTARRQLNTRCGESQAGTGAYDRSMIVPDVHDAARLVR